MACCCTHLHVRATLPLALPVQTTWPSAVSDGNFWQTTSKRHRQSPALSHNILTDPVARHADKNRRLKDRKAPQRLNDYSDLAAPDAAAAHLGSPAKPTASLRSHPRSHPPPESAYALHYHHMLCSSRAGTQCLTVVGYSSAYGTWGGPASALSHACAGSPSRQQQTRSASHRLQGFIGTFCCPGSLLGLPLPPAEQPTLKVLTMLQVCGRCPHRSAAGGSGPQTQAARHLRGRRLRGAASQVWRASQVQNARAGAWLTQSS